MRELDIVRKDIDIIDQKMIELFEERMHLVSEVLEYKKANNKAIFDEKREKEIIEKNIKKLHDESLKEYYEIFFNGVLNSSKKYQEDNYE